MIYQIWYQRSRQGWPNAYEGLTMGFLPYTHIHMIDLDTPDLYSVFSAMQADVPGSYWDVNVAYSLVQKRGVFHTSMSVGDVAVDSTGQGWQVDSFGWQPMNPEKKVNFTDLPFGGLWRDDLERLMAFHLSQDNHKVVEVIGDIAAMCRLTVNKSAVEAMAEQIRNAKS